MTITCLVGLGNHGLGGADDHVAVTCLDDFRQVLDSLLILDLGDDPDVLPLVTKNLSVNVYKCASLKVVAWAYTVSGSVSVSSACLLDGLADGPELESPITEQREAASC